MSDNNDTILMRLMRKLPDGSFEVVGYEKHEGGRIYHAGFNSKKELLCYEDILPDCDGDMGWVKHDRKDRYTGVDIDGVKVFERDEVMQQGTRTTMGGWVSVTDEKGTVKYVPELAKFMAVSTMTTGGYDMNALSNPKLTGIEGVKEGGEDNPTG